VTRSLSQTRAYLLALAAVAATAGIAPALPDRLLNKPDDWYASEEAKQLTGNVLSHQADAGGWPKNLDTSARPFDGDRASIEPTFDNGATTGELRLLARLFNATHDDKYKIAFLKGLDYVLVAQYPNGGWPQSYPPKKDYRRHITFNDDSMTRLMTFAREVATADTYKFVGEDKRSAARREYEKGIECILKCQVRVNGKLTAWCAQHDEVDFRPRSARTYELATLSGSESAGLVRLLMSVEKPNRDIVEAVDAAVEWFRAVEIKGIRATRSRGASGKSELKVVSDPSAGPTWARFYEIGTNRPLFSDRDGIAKFNVMEIGDERRNNYAWYGIWPRDILATEYPAWKARVGGTK
jgi:PelA/Pel-15E family pectate lyase